MRREYNKDWERLMGDGSMLPSGWLILIASIIIYLLR
jgi:hypothetical protein